jgi:hypothetical protein
MRLFLPLLLLPSLIFGAKILSYNVYDRTDRVDIMFAFDTPYEGTLRQTQQNSTIIIKLDDATIESPKVKNVASPFLSKLTITPIGNQTQIITTVAPSVKMQASKTSDAFGLRLRFYKGAVTTTAAPAKTASPVAALPTKPEGQYDRSYMVVILILLVAIVILLWLKSRIGKPSTASSASKPWLFSKKGGGLKEDVNIRFQKALDPKNRVVMLDYADESYLIVIGTSNVLLDKFHGSKPVTQNDFEEMLQNKHEELDEYLQIDRPVQEPLQSYKEKAAGLDR